jgi:hypothetical protein
MGPRKLSRDINMKYTYELKYEIGLKKEKMFFVYESENEIQINVSSIKEIISNINSNFRFKSRLRMYNWLKINHPELLI